MEHAKKYFRHFCDILVIIKFENLKNKDYEKCIHLNCEFMLAGIYIKKLSYFYDERTKTG
jgi:hypothetical protein